MDSPVVASPAGMPWATAHSLGRYGERLAARYLRERGLEVLDQNWRCDLGEIDIVARDGDCLVVCEVKTRRSTTFGEPIEAVNYRKLARLRRLAAVWLAQGKGTSGTGGVRLPSVRVDVVGVLRPRRGPCQITHLVGVLS
jgi:putative endonuclease